MGGVAAVILAAGAGTRFGHGKARVMLGTATLLERAVATTDAAGLAPILAVVGTDGGDVPAPATIVRNDRPSDGLSRSLKLGIAAVPTAADAAVVLLVDQPTVGASLLLRLIDARGDRPVVTSAPGGIVGPPLLLERSAFALVDMLEGDTGLRDVLRARPEIVTAVTLGAPLPDIDTRGDLADVGEPCPGCGVLLHAVDGPTHDYIGASAACWSVYGEVLAREFGDSAYGALHRHTADAYAAQHPGVDGHRQRQSVALHLIALCHWLEHGMAAPELNAVTRRLAGPEGDWPWLIPPRVYGATVVDVLAATSAADHARFSRLWAESVWRAWSPHHDVVRRWAADALRTDR